MGLDARVFACFVMPFLISGATAVVQCDLSLYRLQHGVSVLRKSQQLCLICRLPGAIIDLILPIKLSISKRSVGAQICPACGKAIIKPRCRLAFWFNSAFRHPTTASKE